MSKSRRQFLARTSLGLLGAAAAGPSQAQKPGELPPGAPPAFGTASAVGPEVSPATFAEAEKLMQVELSGAERAVAAGSWRTTMAALYERRSGPRKVLLEPALAPWSRWDPVLTSTGAMPSFLTASSAARSTLVAGLSAAHHEHVPAPGVSVETGVLFGTVHRGARTLRDTSPRTGTHGGWHGT